MDECERGTRGWGVRSMEGFERRRSRTSTTYHDGGFLAHVGLRAESCAEYVAGSSLVDPTERSARGQEFVRQRIDGEPVSFLVTRQERVSASGAKVTTGAFFVHEGTVYESPSLLGTLHARISAALGNSAKAFHLAKRVLHDEGNGEDGDEEEDGTDGGTVDGGAGGRGRGRRTGEGDGVEPDEGEPMDT